MSIISLKHIYKIYNIKKNPVYALNDVSLNIEKNEFVAIIGQSGSGKSTLMNIIGCLDIPTKGQYYLSDKKVDRISEKGLSHIRNKKIGFIFQSFNLIPSMTSLENVELPLIYRGVSKEIRYKKAIEALESVGLDKRMYHRPSELSGGQQQRVAIARVICSEPDIFLADEPTGNLDSKSSEEILNLLKYIHKSGKTLIMITHDNKIANLADRIIKISDGKIIS